MAHRNRPPFRKKIPQTRTVYATTDDPPVPWSDCRSEGRTIDTNTYDVYRQVTMLQVPKPLTGKGKKNSLEWIGLLGYEVSGGQRLSGYGSSTVTS